MCCPTFSFGEPYAFSWSFFPDTVLLTVGFFTFCQILVGIGNVRILNKSRIIELMTANRQNEKPLHKSRWMPMICIFYGILLLWMLEVGVVKYHFYFDSRHPLPVKLMYWGNIVFPALTLLWGIAGAFLRRKIGFSRYLCGLLAGVVMTAIPTFSIATHWHRAADVKDIENYIAAHTLLETDTGTLKLSENAVFQEPVGESIYNLYTDVVYIIPDEVAQALLPVQSNRFVMTKYLLSFKTAEMPGYSTTIHTTEVNRTAWCLVWAANRSGNCCSNCCARLFSSKCFCGNLGLYWLWSLDAANRNNCRDFCFVADSASESD